MIGIYKIESKIKPKRIYIGSAVNIKNRWRGHIKDLNNQKHGNSRLQNHFNKYGETDLIFSILTTCEKDDLIKTEQYFIDSYNPFFNICRTAGNTLGRKHSEETKKYLSELRKIQYKGETNPFYGKHHSEETKQSLREQRIGKKLTEEHKLKCSIALKGKKFSKEHRNKISISLMGHIAINKGKKLTAEEKSLIYTPERLKRMSEAKKGKPLSESHKIKLKIARARYKEKCKNIVHKKKN